MEERNGRKEGRKEGWEYEIKTGREGNYGRKEGREGGRLEGRSV